MLVTHALENTTHERMLSAHSEDFAKQFCKTHKSLKIKRGKMKNRKKLNEWMEANYCHNELLKELSEKRDKRNGNMSNQELSSFVISEKLVSYKQNEYLKCFKNSKPDLSDQELQAKYDNYVASKSL